MILISHRGNVNGPDKKNENNPNYLDQAMASGFNVEIDVWYKKETFFLGHDGPQYSVSAKYLTNPNFWCHAKNLDALYNMKKIGCHYFWHENDKYTITSKGYIWTYPGEKLTTSSICVLPEISNFEITNCAGICSDYVSRYKK